MQKHLGRMPERTYYYGMSAGGFLGRLIQYQPHTIPAQPAAMSVRESADTISPHSDWKQARDELEQKLGGHRARVADRGPEGLNRMARQIAAAEIGQSHGDHQGQLTP